MSLVNPRLDRKLQTNLLFLMLAFTAASNRQLSSLTVVHSSASCSILLSLDIYLLLILHFSF